MGISGSSIAARLLRTRWFVRAPIKLFQVGLGWLCGPRILMVEHLGRSSGLSRYVCLEAVERPSPHRVVIVSGFGERSQWYRNLIATPQCHVSIERIRRAPATARFLAEPEATETLDRYRARRPRDWAMLQTAIEEAVGHPVEGLPMVELTLDTSTGPAQQD